METTIVYWGYIWGLGFGGYSPPYVDRAIMGYMGILFHMPKAIFYLLKGDYAWRIRGVYASTA